MSLLRSDLARESATQHLLELAHQPSDAAEIFQSRIKYRKLDLNPPEDARQQRRRLRQRQAANLSSSSSASKKPTRLSGRERRRLGVYNIPAAAKLRSNYAAFEALHALWLGYVREILEDDLYGEAPAVAMVAAAKLASAEFVGAEVAVVRSSCPSRVGLKGIVIKDSKHVFEIITKGGAIKMVPKEGTVFRVEIPAENQLDSDNGKDSSRANVRVDGANSLVFELLGENFQYRPVDRSNRKFKTHFSHAL